MLHFVDCTFSAEIYLKRPDKYREIEEISSSLENIITMGSCNSYTAASFKKNNLSIDLTKFDRIIEFDKENKLITVEAGINFLNLFNFTLKHDLWLPQTPGYPTITLGGAVATNAHGKSCGYHVTRRIQVNKILFLRVSQMRIIRMTERKPFKTLKKTASESSFKLRVSAIAKGFRPVITDIIMVPVSQR